MPEKKNAFDLSDSDYGRFAMAWVEKVLFKYYGGDMPNPEDFRSVQEPVKEPAFVADVDTSRPATAPVVPVSVPAQPAPVPTIQPAVEPIG